MSSRPSLLIEHMKPLRMRGQRLSSPRVDPPPPLREAHVNPPAHEGDELAAATTSMQRVERLRRNGSMLEGDSTRLPSVAVHTSSNADRSFCMRLESVPKAGVGLTKVLR
eukprot:CAMPEP_0174711576 /NCGR_PEP_ID=MMETSP1094-20130205/12855_1 /TAXON_ID=156173 /ORGANISM="Chrysochromulina brevifilum, Strain UTEX LB 985" /LENGTH=109 /DNA_ID=CAMNT_0015910535 /DNA_START=129 /DNA_END=459 /DNA_ORIENTATION=+